MVKQNLQKALNIQIQKEFYSAYLYLSMSAYCSDKNLNGFAHWFYTQYQEEQTHGHKLYNYLLQRGVKIELEAIEKPKTNFESPLSVMRESLAHEQHMTDSFNKLSDIAIDNRDHATYNFLQWFVNEQVEEESTVRDIISKIERVGENSNALYMLDRELENRTFVDETATV